MPPFTGQYQLECAQLNIKVRELTQQLETSVQVATKDAAEALRETEGKLQDLAAREERALKQLAELDRVGKKQAKELKQNAKKCVCHLPCQLPGVNGEWCCVQSVQTQGW